MSEEMMRRVTTVASGFVLLATTAAGCGLADGSEPGAPADSVEQVQRAITGGWTTLTPINGWQAAGGSYQAPAVGKVDGIVVFRGAIKADPVHGVSSTTAFMLQTAFRPSDINGDVGASSVAMKVVLSGGQGGVMIHDYLLGPGTMRINQDGMGDAVGPEAKALVSLDGASFDALVATPLTADDSSGVYGFRVKQPQYPPAAWIRKTADGFIRFQGYLVPHDPPNNFLFTIPTDMRPGNTLWVTTDIGFGSSAWSLLTVYPDGQVWVDGTYGEFWTKGISLEGVSFSRTLTGNQALPMVNGWTSYSARAARVGVYGGVVRFQGAISGGTSNTICTQLPTSMRPTKTVQVPTNVYGAAAGTITVTPGGLMTITSAGGLTTTTRFTSLDGVSYGL